MLLDLHTPGQLGTRAKFLIFAQIFFSNFSVIFIWAYLFCFFYIFLYFCLCHINIFWRLYFMHFTRPIHFFCVVFAFEVFDTYIFQVMFHFNMFIFRKILFPKLDICNLLSGVRNFAVQ